MLRGSRLGEPPECGERALHVRGRETSSLRPVLGWLCSVYLPPPVFGPVGLIRSDPVRPGLVWYQLLISSGPVFASVDSVTTVVFAPVLDGATSALRFDDGLGRR